MSWVRRCQIPQFPPPSILITISHRPRKRMLLHCNNVLQMCTNLTHFCSACSEPRSLFSVSWTGCCSRTLHILSLVCTSTLPGIDGPSPQDLKPTDLRITAVTGERAGVVGKRSLQITVSTCTVDHKFCLANIQDPCIIGPNMLTK